MADSDQAEQEATRAAEAWLSHLDRGDLAASWNTAARLFRDAVTEEEWAGALKKAQGPLGRVVHRSIRSCRYATELPGAPDGEYVMLEYDSSFEHKKNGTETVVMMQDDGEWRLSGYFIR